jgi:hypothetical protein
MLRLVLLLLIAGLGSQPAVAGTRFFVQQGNWTIVNVDGACIARSRTFSETNMSPVAAVRFIIEADTSEIFLETYFWPGAFKAGQATTLTMVKRRDAEIVVPATASTDYSATADRPFSRAELKILRNEHLIAVKATEVAWPVGAEGGGFGMAYRFLLDCARTVQAD